MINYNLDTLREVVREKLGDEQYDKVNFLINSFAWKLEIAKYHEETASKVFENYTFSNALRLNPGTINSTIELDKLKLISEANTIAFAQSIYSSSDLLANLIVTATNTEVDRDIKLSEIQKKLGPNNPMKTKIAELLGFIEYKYLKDFVNKTKHISLIESNYIAYLQENNHGMEFNGFIYNDQEYPQKNYKKIVDELYKIEQQLIKILQALELFLKSI